MTSNWLIKNNSKKLILFFNGWGMNSSAVQHLKPNNYDIVEFNDYCTISFNENEYVGYKEIYVVAWSLGVWAASFALNKSNLPLSKAIAINGTQNPVHPKEGIHPTIFEGTLNGWNEKNRRRFLIRTIGGKNEFEASASRFGKRELENQKAELSSMYEHIKQHDTLNFKFNVSLIGNRDAIFTPENQSNYWDGKVDYKLVEMPHYPFFQFSTWDEIIKQ